MLCVVCTPGYYNNYHGQRQDDPYYRYYRQQDARYTSGYYDELGYAQYGHAYNPRLVCSVECFVDRGTVCVFWYCRCVFVYSGIVGVCLCILVL